MNGKCGKCGHTEADHGDGIMGASVWTEQDGETQLCHTDDHSCYIGWPTHARNTLILNHGLAPLSLRGFTSSSSAEDQ